VSVVAFCLPGFAAELFRAGGTLLGNPTAIENPFFRLAPDWAVYPLVGLASTATVIAFPAPSR
jgi:KUP system potassium uptake protein